MIVHELRVDKQGTSLLDLIVICRRRWLFVLKVCLGSMACSLAITFLLPNVFRANTRILPPQQAQSGAAALLAQLGGVASVAAGAAGIKNPNDVYIGMLHSRTIADRLIARFKLRDVYGERYMSDARKELDQNTNITSGKDGMISIDVDDIDPKRAAAIANAYTDELSNLTKTLAVTEAGKRRLFFERELQQTKANLAHAEMTLKTTLGSKGVISVDADSRSVVETVARLRALVASKEIERRSMAAFVTANNFELRRLDEVIQSTREELSKLENGSNSPANPGGAAPGGLENIKVLREVKYQQMLYELLSKQYEIARLDEAKETSIIQVLDPAIEPELKARPRRALIALVMGLAGILAALTWLVFERNILAARTDA